MAKKMWDGRFELPTDKLAEEFLGNLQETEHLCPYDIKGSIVHATMLARQNIITQAEADAIIAGLKQVAEEIEKGTFTFTDADEDIHMGVEKRLTEIVGPVGGKLHTGRSRNDQCTLDAKMHMLVAIDTIKQALLDLLQVIIRRSEENMHIIMPGYTHLQTAQPVLFSHWLMAYFQMLRRDYERFESARERTNLCPLGAGALAGTTFPIDRDFTARELGFAAPTENSIDSVSDRDYFLEFMSDAAICQMHLSRLCEEIIIFTSQDFKFIELSDDFCTGSSIMPQKKNPDVAELVRGKTGRAIGNLVSLLIVMKGIPLAYNKDMREDKPLSFDSVKTMLSSLKVMAPMLDKMTPRADIVKDAAGRGYSTATDMADYLVRKGIAFRDAHHIVGRAVNYCIKSGKMLDDLTLEEFKGFEEKIEKDIYDYITLEACVNGRNSYGGTSRQAVSTQIENAKSFIKAQTG